MDPAPQVARFEAVAEELVTPGFTAARELGRAGLALGGRPTLFQTLVGQDLGAMPAPLQTVGQGAGAAIVAASEDVVRTGVAGLRLAALGQALVTHQIGAADTAVAAGGVAAQQALLLEDVRFVPALRLRAAPGDALEEEALTVSSAAVGARRPIGADGAAAGEKAPGQRSALLLLTAVVETGVE